MAPPWALLLAVAAFDAASGFGRGMLEPPPRLAGTIIEHPLRAPDFTLTDQQGLPFHMASTRGTVVVMSFIYTHCTDLCPFVTMKLKAARDLLGRQADHVEFVAVSTDPARDTPPVLAAYSRAAGLGDSWHFLTGPAEAVRKVWFDYGVGVDIRPLPAAADGRAEGSEEEPEPSQGLSAPDLGQARSLAARFGGGYEVSHSTPIWIIDRSGRIRVSMDAAALPSEIAGNIRALQGR